MDDQKPFIVKKPLPQTEQQVSPEMSYGTWMLMIGAALFFDACEALLTFIPIAGEVLNFFVDMFAFATFALWFQLHGMKYSKRTFFGGFIIGLIPIVNALPECTLTIVLLYFDAKAKKVASAVPGEEAVSRKFKKAA